MLLFRRKDSTAQTFWHLLTAKGDSEAALRFYEKQWGKDASDCPHPVRAAYHLQRWLNGHDDVHIKAVEQLAQAEPANSQITRTLHVMRRLEFEHKLAQAIWNRDNRQSVPPPRPTPSEYAHTLTQLGMAVVEALQVYTGEEQRQQGFLVLKNLPDKRNVPEAFHQIYDHLYIWANWVQNQQHILLAQREILEQMQVADPARFLLTAVNRWGLRAASEERHADVVKAIQAAKDMKADTSLLQAMILNWARTILEDDEIRGLQNWLEIPQVIELLETDDDAALARQVLLILGALASEHYNQGRDAIGSLNKGLSEDFSAQLMYLQTLALIASVVSSVQGADSDDDEQSNLNRQTAWRNVRSQLLELIEKLANMQTGAAWRGNLLMGLVSYADRESIIDKAQIESFNRAIEMVDDEQAQRHLRDISANLLNRTLATESAITFIKNRDYASLRSLQQDVLAALGDAVPPLIRASVYMMLWEHDPNYDPLPDLRRIPVTDDIQENMNQAIRQVQFVQVTKQLTRACLAPNATNDTLPAATPLKDNPEAFALAQLATAVTNLHRKSWEQVRTVDIGAIPDMTHEAQFVRFYAAWQMADTKRSSELMREGPDNPYFQKYRDLVASLQSRRFLIAMEQGQQAIISEEIWGNYIVGDNASPEGLVSWTLNLAAWLLIEGRTQELQSLIGVLRADLKTSPYNSPEIDWVLHVLAGMVAAKQNKYILSVDAFDNALNHAYQPRKEYQMLQTWSYLARLQAELGRAAYATEDLNLQWPTIYRSIAAQINALPREPVTMLGYGHLIAGMIKYLTSGAIVDDDTINSLKIAQQLLTLNSREVFLNEVISTLQFRKNVIDDFWNALKNTDFQTARTIYNDQIHRLFGDNPPYTLVLGMIVVDWRTNAAPLSELEQRLNFILQQHPHLQDLIKRLREQMRIHDRFLTLSRLIRSGDFDGVITQVKRQSPEMKNATPQEQLALLLAYLKKQQHESEETKQLLQLTDVRRGAWQGNFRNLIAAYIYFQQKEYEEAANQFGRIDEEQVANKNKRTMWANARFQRGMELLRSGQQTKALNEILAYLKETGTQNEAQTNIMLCRTLLYFGRQNVKEKNGNYALEAFTQAANLVEELKHRDHTAFNYYLVARMGILLTKAKLQGEKTDEPYLRLLKLSDSADEMEVQSAAKDYRKKLEQDFKEKRAALRPRLKADEITPEFFDEKVKIWEEEWNDKIAHFNKLKEAFDAKTAYMADLAQKGIAVNAPLVNGEDFKVLADEVSGLQLYSDKNHIAVILSIYRMMVAQALYREAQAALEDKDKLSAKARNAKFDKLNGYLELLLQTLQKVKAEDVHAIIVQAALLATVKSPPELVDSVIHLDMALNRLGGQSPKLRQFVEEITKIASTNKRLTDEALTLLDLFVLSNHVRDRGKMDWLAQNDALQGVMRLNRQVTPRDLPKPPVQDELTVIKERFKKMQDWVKNDEFANQDQKVNFEKLINELGKKLESLESAHEQLAKTEMEIIKLVTHRFKEQE